MDSQLRGLKVLHLIRALLTQNNEAIRMVKKPSSGKLKFITKGLNGDEL